MSLRAAVYARKSTTQEKGASGDSVSIERQCELARAFAASKGWQVDEAHIYRDDGISGAEFKDRPGLASLLLATKSTPRPFDVVVAMDESRLGRDQFQTAYVLHQISDSRVQLWYYQESRQAKLDDATGKFLESVRGFASEMEREKGTARTRESLRSKHRAGFVAGSQTYGFRHVRDGAHVRLELDESKAAVVRRIFELTATGKGALEIARELNRMETPAPRGGEWGASSIRKMIHNTAYRGVFVYGRLRNANRGGTKVRVRTLESDWITHADEALRIVSEDTWKAAHARLAKARETWTGHRKEHGQLAGRPEGQTTGAHLLGGLLKCGECGATLVPTSRATRGNTARRYYACSRRYKQGSTKCPFRHLLPYDAITDAIIGHFERLHDGALDEIISAEYDRWLTEQAACVGALEQHRAEIARLDTELANLTEAIAAGGQIPALVKALTIKQGARDEAAARLEHAEGLAQVTDPGWHTRLTNISLWVLGTLRETLERRGPEGRELLRLVLREPIRVSMAYEGGEFVGWTYQGAAELGRLIEGRVLRRSERVTHGQTLGGSGRARRASAAP